MAAGVLYPRLRLKGRPLWRDLHAVTGLWAAGLIGFLILTGLPWAGVEGDLLQRGTAALGIGYPPAHATQGQPRSAPMKAALGEAPWTLEAMPMPRSDPAHAAHTGHPGHDGPATGPDPAAVAGTDAVVAALARDHGLAGGYRLFLPDGPTGVYTAYTYPARPQGQRSLYFDRWTGHLIRAVGYRDYGWAAKAIEIGVQLHMGNYFGLANQLVMLAACIAVVAMVVSGVIMWWHRRPRGRLAAPPRAPDARTGGAVVILVLAGIAMPLLGASALTVWALDRLAIGRAGDQARRDRA